MKFYDYAIVPLDVMVARMGTPAGPGAYVSHDQDTQLLERCLADGYRWVRTDSTHAVLEKQRRELRGFELVKIAVEFHGDGSPHTVTTAPCESFQEALATLLWECANIHGSLTDAASFTAASYDIIEHAILAWDTQANPGVSHRNDFSDPECNFTLTIITSP